jgi:hypothetical protein
LFFRAELQSQKKQKSWNINQIIYLMNQFYAFRAGFLFQGNFLNFFSAWNEKIIKICNFWQKLSNKIT